MEEQIIYVLMLNEGVEVWRPMWTDKIDDGIYKIKSFPDYDSTDQELQYKPGDIVVCEKQKKSNEEILVTISKKDDKVDDF